MTGSMFDRILRIDVGKRQSSLWTVPDEVRAYLGGLGYGVKILSDEVDPRGDPLSPDNKLLLTVGPLTGTSAPMHAQTCLVTKSPLTGTILNSYAGGFLGPEIKFCGLDGIVVEGAAEEWTLLLIDDETVRFEPAEAIVGKTTEEAEAYLKATYGADYRTMSIGPAGERAVAMAGAFSETRAFGRGGAGAVLGSKRIKAIGVRGSCGVATADPEAFRMLVAETMGVLRSARADEFGLLGIFSKYGTGGGMPLVDGRGALPTKNHTYGSFEGVDRIDGPFYEENLYTRRIACFGCPVHCGRLHRFAGTDGRALWGRGPEYETMFAFGSNLLNGDADALAEANRLAELYGVDSLTTGVTIAWALEMAEAGKLSEPGLDLRFGDADAVLGLLHRICTREGIGDMLARGPREAALELGNDSIGSAMQVKNAGFAAWMPRRMKGTGLAYATSNRGACHKRAPIGAEISGALDMDSYEGKAAVLIEVQNTVNAIFTLVSCRFHEFVTDHDVYPELVAAASGCKVSWDEMAALGERIWNLEKLFNLKAGLTRDDDVLPAKCLEPVLGESSQSAVIEADRFEEMLDEYYSLRGWDAEGIPRDEKLEELGIAAYTLGSRATREAGATEEESG
ncbi:MAG: aldehyde ferredoxin oxidoreductase family protein [Candidatus Bipolaricaulota bacterium]|nr:MAG: aldehyde ferredoxin oxidoreductase family protein [Candidatus Bipolaricaulota bacterium]